MVAKKGIISEVKPEIKLKPWSKIQKVEPEINKSRFLKREKRSSFIVPFGMGVRRRKNRV